MTLGSIQKQSEDEFQCRRIFLLLFIEKISIWGFVLCFDGKQNIDASPEDAADAKFLFS